jgi:hypothetical protein
MKVFKTKQIDSQSLLEQEFDLFLAASGYETRARNLVESLGKQIKAKNKICIQFSNHQEQLSRTINDQTFKHFKFKMEKHSGDEESFIFPILDSLMNAQSNNTLNILVDYSCMTRIWYASILKYFKYKPFEQFQVNIFFSYSSSQFAKPPEATVYNRHVGPIDGFYSITIPEKPTALIIGLGYVQSRAYGLSEFFDVDPFVFVADSSSNKDFYDEVVGNNERLLRSTNENHIYKYQLNNLLATETLLYSLTQDLLTDYRVVLAPCGPKPFTLLCLITGLRLPEIDVWRISAGEDEVPVDKSPTGYLNILHLTLK